MRSTNRDRSNHRSTAFCAVTVLVFILLSAVCITPVLGNTAEYYVSENATELFAEITLVNQSSYILSSPGFLGEETSLAAKNVTLTNESGGEVEYKSDGRLSITFPEGNYTLTYTAPIEDFTIYASYASLYNASVYLPKNYRTGHYILGMVELNGNVTNISEGGYGTVVTWNETKTISMRFYPDFYEPVFYLVMGIWGAVVLVFGLRYLYLRKKVFEYK